MRRTGWALLLVLGLLVGLTACGGDDGGDDASSSASSDESEADAGGSDEGDADDEGSEDEGSDEGDDAGGSSGDPVEAYCDAALRYVELLAEAIEDPTGVGTELQEAANDYASTALEVGALDPEDQARFDECQEAVAEAAAQVGG